MSLDSWIKAWRKGRLFEAFVAFARYTEEIKPPVGHVYYVRIGSKLVYSDDTADLLKKVEAYLKKMEKRG